MSKTRQYGAALAVVAMALVITGCDDEEEPQPPDAEPTTAPPAPEAQPAAAPTAEAEAPDPEDAQEEDPPGLALDQCLIGSWRLDNDAFAAYLNAMVDSDQLPTGMDHAVDISGDRYLRFDEAGRYYSWSDDFTFAFPDMGAGSVEHVSNSAETGDYDLDTFADLGAPELADAAVLWIFDTMTLVEDERLLMDGVAMETLLGDGSAEVGIYGGDTAEVDFFGVYQGEVPVPARDDLDGITPIRCDGDVLTIVYDAEDGMTLHRTDVTYE